MRLTDASVAIRPRSAWEAIDLGVLLDLCNLILGAELLELGVLR